MNGLKNIIDGIDLLRDYYHDSDGPHLFGDHGIIILRITDVPLTDHSYNKMKELGWFQRTSEYDPEEPWLSRVLSTR